jgi:hypothetical protein
MTSPPPVIAEFSGTVTGNVYDYTLGTPIDNATILAEPFGASSCLAGQCAVARSGPDGEFSISAPVGATTLAFTAPDYVENQTWTDVGRGETIDIGYVFLLHDGFVTGIVESTTPGHAPIADVEVNATSRVGGLLGNPGEITGPSGAFEIPVPPVPSEISLTPLTASSPFLLNTTYANVSSYGSFDLGVVYLEGGVPIQAELYDRSTGLPIPSGTRSQITYCDPLADVCTYPILNETGPDVTGWGLPGPASLQAAAIGYVVNKTGVPDLPDSNGTVDVGRIYLVPMAAAEISSNLTGGTPGAGGWPAGNVTAYVCSLDSLEVAVQLVAGGELIPAPCWPRGLPGATVGNTFPIGTTTLVFGPPLRDAVMIVPQNASPPGFPIAQGASLSPSPEFPSFYANITWANLTPDTITQVGSVDVEAGDYVSGNVTEAGASGSLDGQFSVEVCSTDSAGECGSPVLSSDLEPAVVGCPSGPAEFCAPAPPGPDQITVTELGPNTTNGSWVQVPDGCCAQSGHPIPVGTVGLPAANAYGVLDGIVEARTGGYGSPDDPPGGLFGILEACPVGPSVPGQPAPGCTFGLMNSTDGSFSMVAPAGWDQVTATAGGYQQNWTWVFVNGTNFSGIIVLTPDGYLSGRVLSAAGGGVNGAAISTCPIGTPNDCRVIATAGTNGQYNGSLPGGAYPWATYIVQASYPGFVTDWTWSNATAGGIVTVPNLVLPVLPTPNSTSGNGPSAGPSWVTGTVRDAHTGLPVRSAVVGECENNSCTSFNVFTTYGGTFNLSWIAGEDQILVSAGGYGAEFVAVPNSTASTVSLGVIELGPMEWVRGQVQIGPWDSLSSSDGLGAPVQVQLCQWITGALCGVTTSTDTAGFFNATGPSGTDWVMTDGPGIQAFGSAQGGFDFDYSVESVPRANYTTLSPISDALFLGISGNVRDGTGSGGFLNATADPGFVDVEALPSTSPPPTPFNWTYAITGPSGAYVFFLGLPTDSTVVLTATAVGYRSLRFDANASIPAPGVTPVAGEAMAHDGYLTATVRDATTQDPIPQASVVTSLVDPVNSTTISLGYYTNGSGEVNTTAPAGPAVSVLVSAPGYYSRTYVEPVTAGLTTLLGTVDLTEGAPPAGFFVQSEYVNTAGQPALPTVVDPKTGAPLPDAEIQVAVSNGSVLATTYTNDLGQFLLWVPSSPFIDLTLSLSAFDPVTIYYSTAGAGRLVLRYVNTTGTGIVAGRVVVEPNGTGLYDTEVDVCPTGASGGVCLTQDEAVGFTNVSGDFWVPATRGLDTASVVTEQYLTNDTASVGVSTEGFYEIGTIDVYAFATILGQVRGIPGGELIPDANVSLCSTFGTPYGPCDSSTVTDANGSFSFQAPPSSYVLVATAPGFNESYRSIFLSAGQQLDVGSILLLANGVVTGTAVSAFNGVPIANSTIIVCLTDVPSDCTPFLQGNPDGTFVLNAPPGPAVMTVSAPGFFSNYTDLVVPSGGFVDVGDIALQPLAIDIPESLSGTVTAANRSGAPLPGAFVSLLAGTLAVSSTVSGGDGSFTLPVTWGTYNLVVSAAGYDGVRLPVIVHTNVTGFVVSLTTRLFLVSGTVRDSTTGSPIAAATISENGSVLTTTDASGTYSLSLPNGTYDLVAEGSGSGGVSYSPLGFPVLVAGGSVVHNVSLAEATARLSGVVVDASSGLPIPGASVTVSGGPLTKALTASAGVAGAFAFSLAPGSYLLNVTAPSYSPTSVQVQVPTNGPIDVPLAASARASTGPATLTSLDLAVVGVAVVAVVLVAVAVRYRRPPPPPEPPRWTLEDLPE